MLALELLAERKIAEAIAQGDLDHLPGAGRPLDLGDDALVPEELRMAYRILRNAGFVPAEVEVRAEIGDLERLVLDPATDEEAQVRAHRRLALLRTRIEFAYRDKVLARLARRPR